MLLKKLDCDRLARLGLPLACLTLSTRRSENRSRHRIVADRRVTSARCSRGTTLLSTEFSHRSIHLLLNVLLVELDVVENILLNRPTEEVQLSNSRDKGFVARNLELNALSTAERIEEFLTIGLELILVVHIHDKLLAIQNVRCTVSLAVVCDKPVDQTQTDRGSSLQKLDDFRKILAIAVKALERGHN